MYTPKKWQCISSKPNVFDSSKNKMEIENNKFHIFDPIRLKSFTRLRLGFSNLNEHRPRHNF